MVIQYAERPGQLLFSLFFSFFYFSTFVVVVLHGEDASPGGTSVVDDGFRIQRFDCEGVDDPDGDPLCKETSSHS